MKNNETVDQKSQKSQGPIDHNIFKRELYNASSHTGYGEGQRE